MATSLLLMPDQDRVWVRSDDPQIPDAELDQGHALCPSCDAKLNLHIDQKAPWDDRGIDYEVHYVQEHILPQIRYEETAS